MKRLVTAALAVATFTALLASTAGSWTNVYGEADPTNFSSAQSVAFAPDGSIIVGGCFSGVFNGAVAVDNLDEYVMKLDVNGDLVWIRTWDPEDDGLQDCTGYSFEETHANISIDDSGQIYVNFMQSIQTQTNRGLWVLSPDGETIVQGVDETNAFLSHAYTLGTESVMTFPRADGFIGFSQRSGDLGVKFFDSQGNLDGEWAVPETADANTCVAPNLGAPDGTGGFIVYTEIIPNLLFQQPKVAIYRIDSAGNEVWSTLVQGRLEGGGCGGWTGMEYLVTDTHIIIQDQMQATLEAQIALDLATGEIADDYPRVSDPLHDQGERVGIGGGQMVGAETCFAYEQEATVVAFNYEVCSPFETQDEAEVAIFWEVGDFYLTPGTPLKPLGDGSYAAIVQTNAFHDGREVDGLRLPEVRNAVGLFTLHPEGYLRAETLVKVFEWEDDSNEVFHTRLNDLAVNPDTGQVVVVGRIKGSAQVVEPAAAGGLEAFVPRTSSLETTTEIVLPNALTSSFFFPEVTPPHGFVDVPTTGWKNDAVAWLRQNELTKGCNAPTSTLFCPDTEMSREQQITFLYRYANEPSPGPANSFGDVARGQYYSEPIDWAYNTGVTTGISQNPPLFGTGQPVTRAQAVTFLWRQAGTPAPSGPSPFDDVPPDRYFTQAVAWAFENNVTTGKSSTVFDPEAPVTRVEFAAFLSRYDNLNLAG